MAEHARLGGTGKIPVPSWGKVLYWLIIASKDISVINIQNSFRKCGFTEDLNININVVLDLI